MTSMLLCITDRCSDSAYYEDQKSTESYSSHYRALSTGMCVSELNINEQGFSISY
jgi:hypothetical protein